MKSKMVELIEAENKMVSTTDRRVEGWERY
jgi:hypothetical protein